MKPRSLSDIYYDLVSVRACSTFRFRNTETLVDYITTNIYEWNWNVTRTRPDMLIAFDLDQFELVRLDATIEKYALLSSVPELQRLKQMVHCDVISTFQNSYKNHRLVI